MPLLVLLPLRLPPLQSLLRCCLYCCSSKHTMRYTETCTFPPNEVETTICEVTTVRVHDVAVDIQRKANVHMCCNSFRVLHGRSKIVFESLHARIQARDQFPVRRCLRVAFATIEPCASLPAPKSTAQVAGRPHLGDSKHLQTFTDQSCDRH